MLLVTGTDALTIEILVIDQQHKQFIACSLIV